MKKFSLLLLLVLAGALFFTSCEKENIDNTDTVIDIIDPSTSVVNNVIQGLSLGNEEGLEFGCLTIVYPFEMVTEEGVNVEFNSDDEFFDYMEDSSNAWLIDFVYPLEISDIDDDGVNEEVGDIEELLELFAECIPDDGWEEGEFPAFLINQDNSCYDLVYPITVEDMDGNMYTADDEVELGDILADGNIYFFIWPLDLVDEDGNIVSADSSDELFELLADCEGFGNPCDTIITGGGFIACYELVFPVDVILVNGDIETVEDEDEFFNLMFSGELAGFSYPIELLDEAGNTITINSDEELDEAILDCGWIVGGDQFLLLAGTETPAGEGCYDINFPVSMNMADGSIVTVADMDAYIQNMDLAVSLVYPVSVTLTDDGSVVDLESIEDLFELLENCEG
jgi:hypothetical protein